MIKLRLGFRSIIFSQRPSFGAVLQDITKRSFINDTYMIAQSNGHICRFRPISESFTEFWKKSVKFQVWRQK